MDVSFAIPKKTMWSSFYTLLSVVNMDRFSNCSSRKVIQTICE